MLAPAARCVEKTRAKCSAATVATATPSTMLACIRAMYSSRWLCLALAAALLASSVLAVLLFILCVYVGVFHKETVEGQWDRRRAVVSVRGGVLLGACVRVLFAGGSPVSLRERCAGRGHFAGSGRHSRDDVRRVLLQERVCGQPFDCCCCLVFPLLQPKEEVPQSNLRGKFSRCQMAPQTRRWCRYNMQRNARARTTRTNPPVTE